MPTRSTATGSVPIRNSLLVVLLLLAGCQTLPHAPVDDPARAALFAERSAALSGLDGWTLRGRGALSAAGRGWSGSVHWTQCADGLDLRFIAPLGAGTVRISGGAGAMRVRATDGTDIVSHDIVADLDQWLGVGVPVPALRWWMLGLPMPSAAHAGLAIDAAGRAARFEQAGWSVAFPRYAAHGGHDVPAVVVAERPDARVRLAVERWRPEACR